MPETKFMRGARPSARHILAAASPYRPSSTPAEQFAVVPARLDIWGNATYGDCVSAEEAFAKAWWSTLCGLPETFATEAEVVAFARRYGYLNGASLTEVMDTMIRYGMSIGGKVYTDGAYMSADYSNELILRGAVDPADGVGGPVKIAIDAEALPPGAGNESGWFATSGQRFTNTDHCVGIGGYGRADFLYDKLGLSVPSGLSPSLQGYHLFTWKTIGFVTHDWLMGTCTEAWVRNPTTPGQSPAPAPVPVPPPPGPGPGPAPGPGPLPLYTGTLSIPDQTVTIQVPTGLFGQNKVPVTFAVKGGQFQVVSHPQQSAAGPRWFKIPGDLMDVYAACKDDPVLLAAVEKLVADLGLPVGG